MKPICLNLSHYTSQEELLQLLPDILNDHDEVTILSKFPALFKAHPKVKESYKIDSINIDYFQEN